MLDRTFETKHYSNLDQHQMKVYQRGVSEHASCSCLWTGPDRYFGDEAQQDARTHLEKELK